MNKFQNKVKSTSILNIRFTGDLQYVTGRPLHPRKTTSKALVDPLYPGNTTSMTLEVSNILSKNEQTINAQKSKHTNK